VQKAIALLRAAAADGAPSVSALARAARLPRATALRMVVTMEEEGFLLRVGNGERVVLGPELLALVRGADESGVVVKLAREPLRELGQRLRETVTLSGSRATVNSIWSTRWTVRVRSVPVIGWVSASRCTPAPPARSCWRASTMCAWMNS
jgi:DNA-binding IclR family transcriptional regulator